jgi:hypothetical protein
VTRSPLLPRSQSSANVPVSSPPGQTAKGSKKVEKWLQTVAFEADLHRKSSSELCAAPIHTPAKSSFSDDFLVPTNDSERCCAPGCASPTQPKFAASIRNDEPLDPLQAPLCGYRRRKAPDGNFVTDEMLKDFFLQQSVFADQQVVS